MKIKIKNLSIICFVAAGMFFWSCDNESSEKFGTEYDPNKEVEIHDFEPDGGGLATKVFITGSNFGTDLSKIEVKFGDIPATVVNSTGEYLYVYSPKQDDGFNAITVTTHDRVAQPTGEAVGKKFKYSVNWVVRTLSGRKGTPAFKPGTLNTAEFHNPSTLVADMDGNIFLSHWRQPYCVIRVSERDDVAEVLLPANAANSSYTACGAPTVDADGIVSAISDWGTAYFTFNPIEGWAPRDRTIYNDGSYQGSTMHSLAAHPITGNLYTRGYGSGHIISIDKNTRIATFESESLNNSDSYCVFDPKNPNLLYIAYDGADCIGLYDLEQKKHVVFAGAASISGYQDGPLTQARFRRPSQMIVAPNGNLYVADRGNHCIREIILPNEEEGIPGMVRTIIGKGGMAGYQDGNPDDALFNEPRGVAVLPDGTMYIADYENNVIRKLTKE